MADIIQTQSHPIVTREDAKRLGLLRYFTGAPCKYGHIAERHVSSWTCMECSRIKARKLYLENPDKMKAITAKWRENNPDKIRDYTASYYNKHAEELCAKSRKYYANNTEKCRKRWADWQKSHRDHINAYFRAIYKADPEKVLARNRTYRKLPQYIEKKKSTDKAYRERYRERFKLLNAKWKKSNPDRVLEFAKRYRAKNPESIRKSSKLWSLANRPKKRAYTQNWRARRKAAEGSYDAKDIERLISAQRGKCAFPNCGKSIKKFHHVDHIKPLSKGGSNYPRNLQLLCEKHNKSKGAKDPIDYMQSKGFLI